MEATEALDSAIEDADYWSHQLRNIDPDRSEFLADVAKTLQTMLEAIRNI
jgi:hypothetical protein